VAMRPERMALEQLIMSEMRKRSVMALDLAELKFGQR
jgi:hypothetical protein